MKKSKPTQTGIAISESATNKLLGSVESLFLDYDEKLVGITKISEYVRGKDEIFNYFLNGHRSSFMAKELFDFSRAKACLDSEFWAKAINMTDVLECMSATKRNEWGVMIHEKKTPSFDRETVITTIRNLLLSRNSFMAEKVDGVFRKLSGSHVTNSPLGFKTRMIIAYVLDNFGYVSHERIEFLHDLRSIIAKLMGRDEPKSYNTRGDIGNIARSGQFGTWHEFDGNALKIKFFKKGTAHIEVHPDIAVKLNLILASLYPQAIASEARVVSRAEKTTHLVQDILSYAVTEQLAALAEKLHRIKSKQSAYFSKEDVSKEISEKVEEILEFLGGTQDNNVWSFDYEVSDVLIEIVRTGCIPDKKSHQFYPTKSSLAERVVSLAQICKEDSILEPSAGQGGISSLLPKDQTTCVEIDPINSKVLTTKGFNVVTCDFLKWTSTQKFNKIVMNPPFTKHAAERHIEKASECLSPDGKIVAILPASLRNKILVKSMNHTWSETIQDAFDSTGVNVVILELDFK